jgi:Core-2/I-Branching enzyme
LVKHKPLIVIDSPRHHISGTPLRWINRNLSGDVSSRSEIHLIVFPEAGNTYRRPRSFDSLARAIRKGILMIAYFILLHRYPAQFKRLFKSIYAPGNSYVVHVDKSSGADIATEITDFLAPYQGVAILEPKDALWGGYSLVDAELRGMQLLLDMDDRWTHYINLSGQDFPLKSQSYIKQFFAANPGKQFIRAVDQRKERPATMNRISHLFVEAFGKITKTRVAQPFLQGDTPYIGTQWKAVTRSFCEFVCNDPRAERFKNFYRTTFIADEGFFQTVMMNCGDHGVVINDDLRMIDWVPDGDIKLRPRNYDARDMVELARSPDLFARKFDAETHTAILSLLELHLTSSAANTYSPVVPRKTRIAAGDAELAALNH